jgi:asparagine synthetase B (glutamine-hydrolysing)
MAAILTRRGPDQQGVFSSNLFSFGAARIKIIHNSAYRSTDNSSAERASNYR